MKVVTIGRNEDNDVVVNDLHASRYHLQIIQHDDGHYTLSDFGSTNGTYVNGQKISGEINLSLSDIVRIGNSTIPWRNYFESDSEIKSGLEGVYSNDDMGEGSEMVAPDSIDQDSGVSAGLIISIIISVTMIIGGLTGSLALRGTGSSAALVVVGVILLLVDILKIVGRDKVETNNNDYERNKKMPSRALL